MEEGRTPRGSFEGFTGKERELNYRLQCRKILHMEEVMDKLLKRIKTLEAHLKDTGKELVTITAKLIDMEDKNEKLKVENDCLRKQIKEKVETVLKENEEMKASVKDVEMRQNKWLNDRKFEEESLKKIIKQQENEKQNLTESGKRKS